MMTIKSSSDTRDTPLESAATEAPATPQPIDAEQMRPPNSSTFWYEQIAHNGQSPFIPGGARWKVFRNVVSDYGADNSGRTDSAGAFIKAIIDGAPTEFRRDANQLGTTGQPAVIYIPKGTYLINSPLQLYLGTVLMGDPLHPPILKAGPSFQGDTLIYGKDPHQYSTTNFYLSIKNLQLDSTGLNKDKDFTLLDWSVSQATQLANLVFNMPNYSAGHTGINMKYDGGGSGTYMGDLTFNGGANGIIMINQQYEIKSATFNGCTTAIRIDHCFECVFIDIVFMNTGTGIDMTKPGPDAVGSVLLIDSTASNTDTVIRTLQQTTGDHSLVVQGFTLGSGVNSVVSASGDSILSKSMPDVWVYGNAYTPDGPTTSSHQAGTVYSIPKPVSLLVDGKYFTKPPPTYQEHDVTQVLNVKQVPNYPVQGDGRTDDTANLNAIISTNAGSKILFFPHGTYIVTDTLFFPPGARVVGEA
ncbi:MAG: hypothetical protein M1833_000692 [Piccolia ochrophora]|nr:MAG: hypothetical protein M1833_000692 [Piccolia ochrophora]